MKERKDRVDDAVCAIKAASEEGNCCRWRCYLSWNLSLVI